MNSTNTLRKAIAIAAFCALSSPVSLVKADAPDNSYWWPNRLSLEPLRDASASANPMGSDFVYAEAFKTLDLDALKKISVN